MNNVVEIDIISDLGITFGSDTTPYLIFSITNTAMGYDASTVFPDGIYQIVYEVSDGSNEASAEIHKGCSYVVTKEFYKKVQGLHQYYTNRRESNNTYFKNLSMAWMLREQLINAGNCGDVETFEQLLDTLNDMLSATSTCFNI